MKVEVCPSRIFICEECHRWLLCPGRGHARRCPWIRRLRAYIKRANARQNRGVVGSSDGLGKPPSAGGVEGDLFLGGF